jgi:hypothetical protein
LGVAKRHADDGEGGAEFVREHGEEAGLLFPSLLLFGVTLLDFLVVDYQRLSAAFLNG